MAQKRITVPSQVEKRAEEIRESLGVSNLGEVFALLITRYGTHLKKTWELQPSHPSNANEAYFTLTQSIPSPPTTISHPEMEEEVKPAETDPVISRLATLVDIF